MSKSKDEAIKKSKERHPAFRKASALPPFEIITVVRYDLNTGLFTVNEAIDSMETIYDEKFGGWRTVQNDEERQVNQAVISNLKQMCMLLNSAHADARKGENKNE